MIAVTAIVWFVLLLASIAGVFETMRWSGVVNMFPEGRHWWMLPAQWTSLAVFAALIHWNPF